MLIKLILFCVVRECIVKMDERIETFNPETLTPERRTWFYEEREHAMLAFTPIPRQTNQPVQAPLAPLILPETLMVPAPLGPGPIPPPGRLIRIESGPLPPPEPLERQTNHHHLLSPGRLKEWWEADSLVRNMIMREAGIE
jgi:hypothetical protein